MPAERFPGTSMPDRDWWSALWPDPAAVLRKMGVRPGMSVLDLCCGDGYFTAALAAMVGGRVYALDIDPAMIAVARAEVDRQGTHVSQWLCMDARDLAETLLAPVDYVLIANSFHGVPDPGAMARDVRRLLRPGGVFGILNWQPRPREETRLLGKLRGPQTAMRMAPATVRAIVEPAGFRQISVVDLPPWHYGALFAPDAPPLTGSAVR